MNRHRTIHIDQVMFRSAFVPLVLITVLYVLLFTDFFYRDYKENLRDFSDNWKSSDGSWYDLDRITTGDFDEGITLSKPLPSSTADSDSLCFRSENVNLKVFLEGRQIYSFESKENLTGMGYGHTFHEVGLSADDYGKEITLFYESCGDFPGSKGNISEVFLGPASDYVHLNVIHRVIQFTLTLSIIFFGVLIILIWIVLPDKDALPFDISKFGGAAVLIGLWLITGSGILQLLLGNIYAWHILNRLAIILACYPFVGFFNSMTRTRRKVYDVLAFCVTVFLECGMIFLRYFPGIDMMRSFGIFEAVMAAFTFVIVLIILLDNYYYCKDHSVSIEFKSIYVGELIVILSAVLETALFLLNLERRYLFGTVMRIGVLIFINIVMYNFSKWWVKSQAIADRDRFVNNTLQFAVFSKNPDESVKLMLEYIGRETNAKRAYIYEDVGKGRMQSTYEWFAQGMDPMPKELSVIYSNNDSFKIDKVPEGSNYGHMLVFDPEEVRIVSPGLFERMKRYNIQTVAIGPLRTENGMLGFWTVEDVPADQMEEFGDAMDIISYFLVQSINQRNEQDRMLFYSYHDALSGAQNRSALRKFTNEKLDISQPFGYLLCEVEGLREINNILGQDDGDSIVKETAQCLIDTFGDSNVFRLSGNEFAAFGFESDETFFENDVEIARRKLKEVNCEIKLASVFCSNGTSDLKKVTNYVYNLLKKREE